MAVKKLFVMKTMSHTEKNIVEAYIVLPDNLNDACKTALMEHLSKTMEVSQRKNTTENGFALSFGKWEGPEQSIEEIKDEIKSGRKFKKKDSIFV